MSPFWPVVTSRDPVMVYDAYCALLALPDPVELVSITGASRGRRYTQAGDRTRRDRLKRDLERAYAMWRAADAGRAESSIVCLRRGAGAFQLRKRA